MKFELKEYHRKISNREFIEDIIAVSKKIGKDRLRADDYTRHGKYHYLTIRRRFGSWYAALNKAGLKPARMPANLYPVSEQALFKNLADVWTKLGKQPCEKQVKYPLSRYGRTTYLKHFGSWNNALRKFIEYHNGLPGTGTEIENETETAEEVPANLNQEDERDTRLISLRLRFNVFVRDGFRCMCCGKSPVTHPGVALHCDHVIPWSKGGKTRMDNLRTLCSGCNFGKGDTNLSLPG